MKIHFPDAFLNCFFLLEIWQLVFWITGNVAWFPSLSKRFSRCLQFYITSREELKMNLVEISSFIPKIGLVVVGIVLAECTRQGLVYLQRKNSKKVIRQVIFFPDKQIACKDFFDSVEGCSRIRCDFSHKSTGFRFLETCLVYLFVWSTILILFLYLTMQGASFPHKICKEIYRHCCVLHLLFWDCWCCVAASQSWGQSQSDYRPEHGDSLWKPESSFYERW
jgi:hypothetical protein